jgi:diacylglycerol kinase
MRIPVAPGRDEAAERVSFERQTLEREAADLSAATPQRAKFLESFTHAWNGMIYAFQTQRNARVHLACALAALTLGVALRLSAMEFAVIILAIVAVIGAELINTVAESIVDLVTDTYHPLAKVAKDVAAGVVLWSAIGAVAVGTVIFAPHLLALVAQLAHR